MIIKPVNNKIILPKQAGLIIHNNQKIITSLNIKDVQKYGGKLHV